MNVKRPAGLKTVISSLKNKDPKEIVSGLKKAYILGIV